MFPQHRCPIFHESFIVPTRMRHLPARLCIIGLAVASPLRAESSHVDLEHRLTAEQMRATGLDTLSRDQLALLNRLLRDDSTKAVETAHAEANADAAGGRAPGPARLAGLDDGPITSRAEGRIEGWAPGTVFTLANGQQWKVLKGEVRLRKPVDAPKVVVVPGVAGRWFLQVVDDMPKARVYRID